MQVDKGLIKDINFFGDYFGNGDIKELEAVLTEVAPEKQALTGALKDLDPGAYINGLDCETLLDMILM
jgi:lipoate-protein ligase A